MTTTTLDPVDQAIFAKRAEMIAARQTPGEGDFIVFADGVQRRISHCWGDESVQTTDGGSFYLGEGYCSYSGSLYPGIPTAYLYHTGETEPGRCWIFHLDRWGAGRGVDSQIEFPVWKTGLNSDGTKSAQLLRFEEEMGAIS